MNPDDQKNIEFVRSLAADPEGLRQWFDCVKEFGDEDEVQYAIEILSVARNLIELDLLALFDADAEEDVSDAREYLKRFQLR
jgi:hypothetical protein